MKVSQKTMEELPEYVGISAVLAFINGESEEPVDIEIAIAYIADVSKFELEDLSYSSIYKLNQHVISDGQRQGYITIVKHTDVLYESDSIGLIKIQNRENRFYYNGYYAASKPITNLSINGREFEHRVYEKAIIDKAIENVKVLLDEGDKKISSYDRLQALSDVFISQRNGDVGNKFGKLQEYAIRIMNVENPSCEYAAIENKMNWIIDKYLEYLWGKKDDESKVEYILGFISFIEKNIEYWCKGLDNEIEYLNLYTKEHDIIRNAFTSAKEPLQMYSIKCLSLLQNNEVCEEKVNYRSEIAPLMPNGSLKTIGRN